MASKKQVKTVNIQVRIAKDLKERAEQVLTKFDITMSEAFRLFLNDVARNQRIPVLLTLNPNTQTETQNIPSVKILKPKLLSKPSKNTDLSSDQPYTEETVYQEEKRFYGLLKKVVPTDRD